MKKRNLTCIVCPIGCELTVETEGDKIISIIGNTCERGKVYAYNECTHPARVLTTTVKVKGGKLLPVKSNKPLPKENIHKYMDIINNIIISPPVSIGDIIIKNIDNTGIDIVATQNIT